MRISKLSERACLPVGTVKFYLRTGLLHPGRATSATQALYDDTHVDRLRLIRALLEVGRLSLAEIQQILDAIDGASPDTKAAVTRVQRAIGASSGTRDDVDVAAAETLLVELGWHVAPDSPHLPALARALRAASSVGLVLDHPRLQAYADAAAHVSRSDADALTAVEGSDLPLVVAVSTVLLDPILIALRRLAVENGSAVDTTVERSAADWPLPVQRQHSLVDQPAENAG